jgi:uncharacterized protein (TIGR02996 family)
MRLPSEILAHPDDLAARLAFADALQASDPDLAAFVRLGVQAARLAPEDPALIPLEQQTRRAYRGRAKEALYERHRSWLGAPILAGGLIEGGTVDAADFLANADAGFAEVPIRHLVLTSARPVLAAVLAAPWLGRLRSLELPSAGLDDADAARIADAAGLAGLAWLGLPDNAIGPVGVQALAASPHLAALQVLDLRLNPAPPLRREPLTDAGEGIGHLPNPYADALIARFGWRPWLGRADAWWPSKTTVPVRSAP